jgi:hypothetical protein
VCFQSFCSLCCVLVFSSLFFIQFFFSEGGSVCPGSMLVYPKGGWGNTVWFTSLICQISPKQIWSWCLVEVVALLFSQYNVAWKSFLRLGIQVSGVEILILLGSLYQPSVSSASQQDFDSWRSQICFCTLVTILDPPSIYFSDFSYWDLSTTAMSRTSSLWLWSLCTCSGSIIVSDLHLI